MFLRIFDKKYDIFPFLKMQETKIYKIPTIFKHLPDISPKVSKQLIFGIIHSYEIELKVNIEVFEEFLEYLTND